jgi:hypothetical protein
MFSSSLFGLSTDTFSFVHFLEDRDVEDEIRSGNVVLHCSRNHIFAKRLRCQCQCIVPTATERIGSNALSKEKKDCRRQLEAADI